MRSALFIGFVPREGEGNGIKPLELQCIHNTRVTNEKFGIWTQSEFIVYSNLLFTAGWLVSYACLCGPCDTVSHTIHPVLLPHQGP